MLALVALQSVGGQASQENLITDVRVAESSFGIDEIYYLQPLTKFGKL